MAVILMQGCAADLESPDVPAASSQLTGLGNAIVFDPTGGRLDMPADVPQTLTLIDAIRFALHSDPKIQQALARVRIAEADARQTRLLPNPILNLTVRFREANSASPIITPIITADLLSYIQRPGRITVADDKLRSAAADALSAVLDSLADVQQKYNAAATLDAQIAVLRERSQILQKQLSVAQSRFKIGESARLDVLTLQAQALSLQAEIEDRQLDRITQRLALARAIGQPSGRTDWTLASLEAVQPSASDEARWVMAALRNRPEVQGRRWDLAALGDELGLARLAAFDTAQIGVESERDVTWSVGPTITTPLPFFDWGQEKRARIRAEIIEARHKMTDIRRQVVEETRRAYQTLSAAQSAVQRMRSQVIPLQLQRRQQAEAAYNAGEADLATVLLAQQDFQDARAKEVDLQSKLSSARIALDRAVGGPAIAADIELSSPRGLATSGPATRGPSPRGPATSGPAASGPATRGRTTSAPASNGPASNGPATRPGAAQNARTHAARTSAG